MNGLESAQIAQDMAMFTGPSPEDREKQLKDMEAREKKQKKEEAAMKKLQQTAKKFEETARSAPPKVQMTPDQEAKEKTRLLRMIAGYMAQFPDRLAHVALPRGLGPDKSIEELRVLVLNIEAELGRGDATRVLTFAYVQGMGFLEQAHYKFNPFKFNLKNLGPITARIIGSEQDTISPLLAELSIKYGHWFNSSVESRLMFATLNLLSEVSKHNNSVDSGDVRQAQETPSSNAAREKAAEL